MEDVDVEHEEADERFHGEVEVVVDEFALHVDLVVCNDVFQARPLDEGVLRGEDGLDLAQLADRLDDLHDDAAVFSQQLRQLFVHQQDRQLDRVESGLPDVRLHALAQDRQTVFEVRVLRFDW